MSKPGAKGTVLGFLAVRPTAGGGVRGAYLLTTVYGRPIEFHYTSELRLVGPQRILYGSVAPEYLHVEVLAQPLTEKQSVAPQVVLVDRANLLELRTRIPAPVLCLGRAPAVEGAAAPVRAPVVEAHVDFRDDAAAFEKLRSMTPVNFDWLEPFERLEAAMAEIRDSKPALPAPAVAPPEAA